MAIFPKHRVPSPCSRPSAPEHCWQVCSLLASVSKHSAVSIQHSVRAAVWCCLDRHFRQPCCKKQRKPESGAEGKPNLLISLAFETADPSSIRTRLMESISLDAIFCSLSQHSAALSPRNCLVLFQPHPSQPGYKRQIAIGNWHKARSHLDASAECYSERDLSVPRSHFHAMIYQLRKNH